MENRYGKDIRGDMEVLGYSEEEQDYVLNQQKVWLGDNSRTGLTLLAVMFATSSAVVPGAFSIAPYIGRIVDLLGGHFSFAGDFALSGGALAVGAGLISVIPAYRKYRAGVQQERIHKAAENVRYATEHGREKSGLEGFTRDSV
jgi:hypothetical protein